MASTRWAAGFATLIAPGTTAEALMQQLVEVSPDSLVRENANGESDERQQSQRKQAINDPQAKPGAAHSADLV